MPSNDVYVCVPCREVFAQTDVCPRCSELMTRRHSSWRAPRRDNDRAWARVARGDWLWEDRTLRRLGGLRRRSTFRPTVRIP